MNKKHALIFSMLAMMAGSICGADASEVGQQYFAETAKKVMEHYKVPSGFEAIHAKIAFQVDERGNVLKANLLNDPDAPAEGQSVVSRTAMIKAIKNAAPLTPPREMKTPVKLIAEFKRNESGEGVNCSVSAEKSRK